MWFSIRSAWVRGSVFGAATWQNPSAITQSDTSYAYIASPGAISDYLMANGFGFTIPSKASIKGIVVYFYRKGTAEGLQSDYSLNIVRDWLIVGRDHASSAPWPTNWTLASYGNSTDPWGVSWTPSQINSNGFGVAISTQNSLSGGNDCYIDYVKMSVYYSGGSTSTVQSSNVPFLGIGVMLTSLLIAIALVKRRSVPARTEEPEEESWQASPAIEREQDLPEVGVELARSEAAQNAFLFGKYMVCNQAVYSADEILACPYCGSIAHKTHILEWLHVNDYCPACHSRLEEDNLGPG
jgi:hypothetical protein